MQNIQRKTNRLGEWPLGSTLVLNTILIVLTECGIPHLIGTKMAIAWIKPSTSTKPACNFFKYFKTSNQISLIYGRLQLPSIQNLFLSSRSLSLNHSDMTDMSIALPWSYLLFTIISAKDNSNGKAASSNPIYHASYHRRIHEYQLVALWVFPNTKMWITVR